MASWPKGRSGAFPKGFSPNTVSGVKAPSRMCFWPVGTLGCRLTRLGEHGQWRKRTMIRARMTAHRILQTSAPDKETVLVRSPGSATESFHRMCYNDLPSQRRRLGQAQCLVLSQRRHQVLPPQGGLAEIVASESNHHVWS